MRIHHGISNCPASIAISCVLWLVAVITIHTVDIESWKGSTSVPLIAMCLLSLTTPILVAIVKIFAAARWADLSIATAWMTTTALLLDDLAIAFYSSVYGTDRASLSTASALLLFGAGATQLVSLCITAYAERYCSRKERDEMS